MRSVKPKLILLATGGTIAGEGGSPVVSTYTSGKLSADQLIQALPKSVFELADIDSEQFCNVPSQDIDDHFLIKLSQRVNTLLVQDKINGIVITHGTDTLEETAYFLSLVTTSSKPVILTGAMRPSTATSADGPMNIVNAITTAASHESENCGVVVVMNESIFGARGVVKSNTTAVNTFVSPNFGPLGNVRDLKAAYYRQPKRLHTEKSQLHLPANVTVLPQVGIVYAHGGHDFSPIKAFCEARYKGVVLAGMGNGNLSSRVLKQLSKYSQQSMHFIRSSRCYSGTTGGGEIDDEQYGLISSQDLNPQKSRILLQLALLKTNNLEIIRELFQTH